MTSFTAERDRHYRRRRQQRRAVWRSWQRPSGRNGRRRLPLRGLWSRILYGGSGSDRLIGGDGGEVDALYGGDGVDRFQAGGNVYGTDYLWDFVPNVDRIAVWSGTTIAAQYTQSGNYYVDFTNGTRAVVVGVTALGAFDIELFGFVSNPQGRASQLDLLIDELQSALGQMGAR